MTESAYKGGIEALPNTAKKDSEKYKQKKKF